MSKEPLIVIKKADGTTVRMPLSQFREQKAKSAEGASAVAKTVPAPMPRVVPRTVPTSAPAKPVAPRTSPTLPPKPSAPVARTVPKAPITSPPVQKSVPASAAAHTWDEDDHKSLLDESLHTDLPMVIEKDPLHIKTAIAEGKKPAPTQPLKPVSSGVPLAKEPYVWRPTTMMINKDQAGKPVLHDVVKSSSIPPSRPKIMGPAEELGALTLLDFRRFGANTAARAEALTSKFTALQKESLLLFMKGLAAWRQSPLHRAYMEIIRSALNTRETVDAVMSRKVEKSDLTKEELLAIIGVNERIRV